MKYFILSLCLIISGCSKNKIEIPRFDYYEVKCVNGEVWISSKHGEGPIGGNCLPPTD